MNIFSLSMAVLPEPSMMAQVRGMANLIGRPAFRSRISAFGSLRWFELMRQQHSDRARDRPTNVLPRSASSSRRGFSHPANVEAQICISIIGRRRVNQQAACLDSADRARLRWRPFGWLFVRACRTRAEQYQGESNGMATTRRRRTHVKVTEGDISRIGGSVRRRHFSLDPSSSLGEDGEFASIAKCPHPSIFGHPAIRLFNCLASCRPPRAVLFIKLSRATIY